MSGLYLLIITASSNVLLFNPRAFHWTKRNFLHGVIGDSVVDICDVVLGVRAHHLVELFSANVADAFLDIGIFKSFN